VAAGQTPGVPGHRAEQHGLAVLEEEALEEPVDLVESGLLALDGAHVHLGRSETVGEHEDGQQVAAVG
jgi:hypothetical protein